ncbi:hypothetical protein JD969_00315 [Planctomycetota bacterium]|nr:hypothetical protein JD969_00315 [Planctomycetota bacterium]
MKRIKRIKNSCVSQVEHNRLGLTLAETIFAGVVIAAILAVLVLISQSLRTDNEVEETEYRLSVLHHALTVYHETYDTLLPEDTSQALTILLSDSATAPLLRGITVEAIPGTPEKVQVLDGFGNSIRYVPPQERGNAIGDFVSAGVDKSFGDVNKQNPEGSKQDIDNMFSSETDTKME